MKIIVTEDQDILKSGIYHIKNTVNNKIYVGSAVKLQKRYFEHLRDLKNGNHKNKHLLRAFQKDGGENFQFIVLFNCEKEECFPLEQIEIDSYPFESIYNINPLASGTPNLSQETIDKRNISINKFREEAKYYYYKFKHKVINISDIPDKYLKQIKQWSSVISNDGWFEKGFVPWNKGKDSSQVDYSFLKGVPKTISPIWIEARKKIFIERKERFPEVEVYDKDWNLLGKWKSAEILEEESMREDFILIDKMIIRNKKGRNGYPPQMLATFNVQKGARTGYIYKGLRFKLIQKL